MLVLLSATILETKRHLVGRGQAVLGTVSMVSVAVRFLLVLLAVAMVSLSLGVSCVSITSVAMFARGHGRRVRLNIFSWFRLPDLFVFASFLGPWVFLGRDWLRVWQGRSRRGLGNNTFRHKVQLPLDLVPALIVNLGFILFEETWGFAVFTWFFAAVVVEIVLVLVFFVFVLLIFILIQVVFFLLLLSWLRMWLPFSEQSSRFLGLCVELLLAL